MTPKYKTDFQEFAAILGVYFQGNQKAENFTQWLFENIYTGNDSVLSDIESRTFRGYYYGQHDISVLAKKVASKLDCASFAKAIKLQSVDSEIELCNQFRKWFPEINEDSYGQDIAERFQEIIKHAALPKQKAKASVREHDSNSHKTDAELKEEDRGRYEKNNKDIQQAREDHTKRNEDHQEIIDITEDIKSNVKTLSERTPSEEALKEQNKKESSDYANHSYTDCTGCWCICPTGKYLDPEIYQSLNCNDYGGF